HERVDAAEVRVGAWGKGGRRLPLLAIGGGGEARRPGPEVARVEVDRPVGQRVIEPGGSVARGSAGGDRVKELWRGGEVAEVRLLALAVHRGGAGRAREAGVA